MKGALRFLNPIIGEFDSIILPEMSDYLYSKIASSQKELSSYKNCGHLSFFEYAERFNEELERFISRV